MLRNDFRDYLVPGKLEMFFYFIVAIVVLFVASFQYLTTYFTGEIRPIDEEAFRMYSNGFFGFIEGLPLVPSAAVFFFWSLTGLAIFSLAQSVYNVYAEFKGNVNLDKHYLHPSNYTRERFWNQVLVQFTTQLLLYGLIILWGLLMGFVLTPLAAVLAWRLFTHAGVASLAVFISSFLLLFIGVLVFALLLKLFFKRKQLMV